jgi:hypothetical protein
MKKPFLYIILAIFFTIILIIYNQLGGFDEPEITYEPITEYVIAGKRFEGKISDPAMEDLFSEMRLLKQEKGYNGPLVMIWYSEVKKRNDSVKVFIGIEVLPGEIAPEHLATTKIQMNGIIRAKINAHASVMPGPAKVLKRIRIYADKNNYELQDIIIDKYPEESVVFTEVPIKSL